MSKETFQWTNELLKEWGEFFMRDRTGKKYDDLVTDFKQSKMPKKDWEIVEFISPQGGKITKANDNITWEEWGVKSFDGLTINVVKRLMDMTIWYVGEKPGNLLGKNDTNVITKFSIREDGSMWVNGPGFGMNLNDLEKLPPQSKPEQPKKERIVITQYSNINIPEEKFPAIKVALERVLNDEDEDEDGYDGASTREYFGDEFGQFKNSAEKKGWTCIKTNEYDRELREAEEKAFIESRLTNSFLGFKHNSFKDYLKSKQ